MALSEIERKYLEKTAMDLAFQAVREATSQHIASCPHGKAMTKWKWLAIGIAVGSALGGLGGGFSLAKTLLGM